MLKEIEFRKVWEKGKSTRRFCKADDDDFDNWGWKGEELKQKKTEGSGSDGNNTFDSDGDGNDDADGNVNDNSDECRRKRCREKMRT